MRSKIIRSLRLRAVLIAACLFSFGVGAQGGPPTPPATSVVYATSIALSVSGTSSRVALPIASASFTTVYVYNSGSVEACFALGSSSVVATVNGICVPAGTGLNTWTSATTTNLAAITATGTTTLRIYQANGQISLRGGGGGSGGGGGVTSFNTRTGAVTLVSGDIPSNAANTSGNAATATALAANPTDCSANQFATAIDASGNLTCVQPSTITTSGVASTPALSMTGTPFSGTATTAFPLLYLNQTGATASSSLLAGGTFIGVNQSGSADFLNLLLNGTSKFRVTSTGATTAIGLITGAAGLNVAGAVNLNASNNAITSLGTGTTTSSVLIGGGANDVVVQSHLSSTGTAPGTPSSCGTGSPTVAGSDSAGTITTGTAATACTIAFATTFTTTPKSAVCSSNNAAIACAVTSLSAISITFGLSAALSGTIYYWVTK